MTQQAMAQQHVAKTQQPISTKSAIKWNTGWQTNWAMEHSQQATCIQTATQTKDNAQKHIIHTGFRHQQIYYKLFY